MNYDEDLLVELIAGGDVSQTEIAEKVGVSRRTVWRIANGLSRPDLQTKIAATVEGIRQATIRMAAKWMKPLLHKEIKTALEGDGETARKCREFLLKTFMIVLPEQAAKTPAKKCDPAPAPDRQLDGTALYNSLVELPPDLKRQVVEELGGPAGERFSPPPSPVANCQLPGATPSPESTEVEEAPVLPSPLSSPSPVANCQLSFDPELVEGPVATPLPDDPVGDQKCKKKPFDPFSTKVDGPHGKKVYAESIRLIEEAKAEAAANPPRRRVPRSPNPYHHP